MRTARPSRLEYLVAFMYFLPFLFLLVVRSGAPRGTLFQRLLLGYGAVAAPIGLSIVIANGGLGGGGFFMLTGLLATSVYVLGVYVEHVTKGRAPSKRLAALAAGVRGESSLTRLVASEEPTVQAARDGSAGRVMLGSAFDALLSANPQRSVLLLGPARSGKTSTVLAPTIARWDGPVIVTTTKDGDDALDEAVIRLENAGRPYFEFSPTRPLLRTDSGEVHPAVFYWSPLTRAKSWAGARIVAREMTNAMTSQGERSGQNAYFVDRAESVIAAMLHVASGSGASMKEVVSWAMNPPRPPAPGAPRPIGPWEPEGVTYEGISSMAWLILDAMIPSVADSSGGQAAIWSTVARTLGGYLDEHVLAWSDAPEGWEWSVERFLREDGVLVITATSREQANAVASVTGLVADMVETRYSIGREGAQPLLLALDELANIVPLHDLPSILSEGGSQGVTTMAVFQDLSQARSRFPIGDGLLSLANNIVVWPGIRDRATLEVLERIAGTEYHRVTTTSTMRGVTSGRESSSTTNQTTQGEAIQSFNALSAAELSRGHPFHAALFSSDVPPFFMRMHLLDAPPTEPVATTREQPIREIELIVGEREPTEGVSSPLR